jgi:hypothetical protein
MKMIIKRKVRKVKNSSNEHTKTTGNSTLGSDQEFEELTNEYGELIEVINVDLNYCNSDLYFFDT